MRVLKTDHVDLIGAVWSHSELRVVVAGGNFNAILTLEAYWKARLVPILHSVVLLRLMQSVVVLLSVRHDVFIIL